MRQKRVLHVLVPRHEVKIQISVDDELGVAWGVEDGVGDRGRWSADDLMWSVRVGRRVQPEVDIDGLRALRHHPVTVRGARPVVEDAEVAIRHRVGMAACLENDTLKEAKQNNDGD